MYDWLDSSNCTSTINTHTTVLVSVLQLALKHVNLSFPATLLYTLSQF